MELDLSKMERSPLWVVKDTLPEIYIGNRPSHVHWIDIVAIPPIKEGKYTLHIRPSIKFSLPTGDVEFIMECVLKISNSVNEAYFFEAGAQFACNVVAEYNAQIWARKSSLTSGNTETQYTIPSKEELKTKMMTDYTANTIN